MATKANIVIDQGANFNTSIALTDGDGGAIDLTGYTGASQLRKHFTSSNSKSFSVSLGGMSGSIGLQLTAAETANLEAGRYVYDVEITQTSTNTVTRIVEGIITVTPNVTR